MLVIPALPVRTNLALVQEFQSSAPNSAMTPLRSPVPITVGIQQNEELSPVKWDLLDLFGAGPRKVISPLPETPEKLPSASGNARTIIKINLISHLEMPTSSGIQDHAKRSLVPPSLYNTSPEATRTLLIRVRVRKTDNYKLSQLDSGE